MPRAAASPWQAGVALLVALVIQHPSGKNSHIKGKPKILSRLADSQGGLSKRRRFREKRITTWNLGESDISLKA